MPGSFYYDSFDERRTHMLHRSADEIDDIQSQQIDLLLDQWEVGETAPEDILLKAANIVGAEHIGFFISYRTSLEYNVPGTEGFDAQVQRARGLISSSWSEVGPFASRELRYYKEHIEDLKEREFSPSPEIIASRKQDVVTRSRDTGIDVFADDAVFTGPDGYVETMNGYIELRKQAQREGDEYAEAEINVYMINLEERKQNAERDYNDPEAAIERYKTERRAEHDKTVAQLREKFRPDVLDGNVPTEEVAESIRMIRQKMADLEMSSWDAAVAIGEIILKSNRKFEEVLDETDPDGLPLDVLTGSGVGFSALDEFESSVRQEESRCETTRKKDPEKTRNLLDPETEEDMKGKYLSSFLAERPYQEWRVQAIKDFKERFPYEKYPDTKPEVEDETPGLVSLLEDLGKKFDHVSGDAPKKPVVEKPEDEGWTKNEWRYQLESRTDKIAYERELERQYSREREAERAAEKELKEKDFDAWHAKYRSSDYDVEEEPAQEEDREFRSPLITPEGLIISGMHIVPSGTGLIQLYEGDPSHDWVKTETARITTYAVSLVPKHEEDLETLRDLAQQAIRVVGQTPYDYMYARNDRQEAYERFGDRFSYQYFGRGSDYVSIEDGQVKLRARVDLDDLYVLYYLLEPAIEPNEQIAAAMNAARYAEERGAILTPDPFQDEFDQGYMNDDQPGTLKKGENDDTLAEAIGDTIRDFAMDRIDQAAFVARLQVITDHTLTGQMKDVNGILPTFEELKLIGNDTSNDSEGDTGNDVITYEQAMKERLEILLKAALGLEPGSGETLKMALMRTVHKIGPALKEEAREQADEHGRKLADHLEREWGYSQAQMRQNIREGKDAMSSLMDETEFARKLSDAFAGRVGPKDFMDEDYDPKAPEERQEGLVFGGSLVVRDSEVETCLDGIHDLGGGRYYRSRTKDSLLPRKELPSALKPFEPQHDPRYGLEILMLEGL